MPWKFIYLALEKANLESALHLLLLANQHIQPLDQKQLIMTLFFPNLIHLQHYNKREKVQCLVWCHDHDFHVLLPAADSGEDIPLPAGGFATQTDANKTFNYWQFTMTFPLSWSWFARVAHIVENILSLTGGSTAQQDVDNSQLSAIDLQTSDVFQPVVPTE